ncbi:MAG: hypothetical protein A2Z73_00305 [Deltaproteobacteria bacterium RBG_13_60_28]|nr:MAG: hypothetical protein A2Z73_00305 [Deltaproteobacteria bacterium RBG_13_60_28]
MLGKISELDFRWNRCIYVPNLADTGWKTIRICIPNGVKHFIFIHKCDVIAFNKKHRDKSTLPVMGKFIYFCIELARDSFGERSILGFITCEKNSRGSITCLCYLKAKGNSWNIIKDVSTIC